LFIKWYGIWCPCCGCRLRANPRNTVNRRRVRRRKKASVCLSCIRSIRSVNMSSDNEYEIRELRKEIDYLAEDVERLKRLVKNMKDVNSLKLTADDEEYLRGID
jgi:cell division protein FtsB